MSKGSLIIIIVSLSIIIIIIIITTITIIIMIISSITIMSFIIAYHVMSCHVMSFQVNKIVSKSSSHLGAVEESNDSGTGEFSGENILRRETLLFFFG